MWGKYILSNYLSDELISMLDKKMIKSLNKGYFKHSFERLFLKKLSTCLYSQQIINFNEQKVSFCSDQKRNSSKEISELYNFIKSSSKETNILEDNMFWKDAYLNKFQHCDSYTDFCFPSDLQEFTYLELYNLRYLLFELGDKIKTMSKEKIIQIINNDCIQKDGRRLEDNPIFWQYINDNK